MTYQFLSEKDRILEHVYRHGYGGFRSKTDDIFFENKKIEYKTLNVHQLFLRMFDELMLHILDKNKVGSCLSVINVTVNTNTIIISDNAGIDGEVGIINKVFGTFDNMTTSHIFDVGVSLVNLLSKHFEIHISNGDDCKSLVYNGFRETSDNIHKQSTKFSIYKYVPDFTTIEYGQEHIHDDDIVAIHTRLNEIAACNPNMSIRFNGTPVIVEVPGTETFSKMMGCTDIHTTHNNGWELSVSNSPLNRFVAVSFVNSTRTRSDKSNELQYILNEIIPSIKKYIYNKTRINVTSYEIKKNMAVVLNSKVAAPEFKDTLNSELVNVLDECKKLVIDQKYKNALCQSDIVTSIISNILEKKSKTKQKLNEKVEREILQSDTYSLEFFKPSINSEILYICTTEHDFDVVSSYRNVETSSVLLLDPCGYNDIYNKQMLMLKKVLLKNTPKWLNVEVGEYSGICLSTDKVNGKKITQRYIVSEVSNVEVSDYVKYCSHVELNKIENKHYQYGSIAIIHNKANDVKAILAVNNVDREVFLMNRVSIVDLQTIIKSQSTSLNDEYYVIDNTSVEKLRSAK